ncbi:MAG: DUF5320 domain-containing protein [Actinomycetota bacterium]
MPGGDRTGPMGEGSMTGRGAGYCVGEAPGRGLGLGIGRGLGRGFLGRSRGVGLFGRRAGAYPLDERESLSARTRALESELDRIKGRIGEIDQRKGEA